MEHHSPPKSNKFWQGVRHFFKNLWHNFEPIFEEFCLQLLIFLSVYLFSFLIKPLIPDEFRETYTEIKKLFLLGIFGIFGVHACSIIFIRFLESVNKERKRISKSKDIDEEKNAISSQPKRIIIRLLKTSGIIIDGELDK